MSQWGERVMEEMRSLLNRISKSGIEVPQTVREAMCNLHLEQFTTYDFNGFFHDRPVVFMETENGGVKTISAPHMIVTLLHHLELHPGQEVLVVGSKGGYMACADCKHYRRRWTSRSHRPFTRNCPSHCKCTCWMAHR